MLKRAHLCCSSLQQVAGCISGFTEQNITWVKAPPHTLNTQRIGSTSARGTKPPSRGVGLEPDLNNRAVSSVNTVTVFVVIARMDNSSPLLGLLRVKFILKHEGDKYVSIADVAEKAPLLLSLLISICCGYFIVGAQNSTCVSLVLFFWGEDRGLVASTDF